MEPVQKDYWYSLALLTFLVFLEGVQDCSANSVVLEDGMILDCLCPWEGNLSMVSWTKHPDKSPIAIFHPRYGTKLSEDFTHRLEFLRRTYMDGSISISSTTDEDIGQYQCSMQTFPKGSWVKVVHVHKENYTPDVEAEVKEGHNVTLLCPLFNNTVSQVVIMKEEQKIGECGRQDSTLVLVEQHERIQLNCASDIGVSFDLNEVTQDDQGRYQCFLSTESGLDITNFFLTVSSEEPTTGAEEAAELSTVLSQQFFEEPNPAEGTPIAELPSSDAAVTEPVPSAPTERNLTTDSGSPTTNLEQQASDAAEESFGTKGPSVLATFVPHSIAVTEGKSETEVAPSVVDTTDSLTPAPSEAVSTPEASPSLLATTLPPAPEATEGTVTSKSVVATISPHLAESQEKIDTLDSAPVAVTTVPLPSEEKDSTEGMASDEEAPSHPPTAGPQTLDLFWWFPDIPEEYWLYIYAGAAGLLLLLIIIIVISVAVCLYRRKKRREAYRIKLQAKRGWRDLELGNFYDRMRKGTIFSRQDPIYANVRTAKKYRAKPTPKQRRRR